MEGVHLTIVKVLVSALLDRIVSSMNASLVSPRQMYLVEFGRYLDTHGVARAQGARARSV